MKKQIISSLLFISIATATAAITAAPLSKNLTGSGCIIDTGDHANSTITFTLADLTKTYGTISPGQVITHVVTFVPDYGVTDIECSDATVAISLGSFVPSTQGGLSLDSLTISGTGTTRAPILNNVNPVTVVLTMTAQSTGSIASKFTYSVPFTLIADVKK